MRVITPRAVDSPAIGTGSRTCMVFNLAMNSQEHKKICKISADNFCYVCAKYVFRTNRKVFNDRLQHIYESYFRQKVASIDKSWTPNSICGGCASFLTRWSTGNVRSCKMSEPAKWLKPVNEDDCYFCSTEISGRSKKSKSRVQYADVGSVTQPVYSDHNPVTAIRGNESILAEEGGSCDDSDVQIVDVVDPESSNSSVEEVRGDTDSEDEAVRKDKEPKRFNQKELNDLVRDLGLPKDASELLASRLKAKNLLEPGTKVTVYRTREQNFLKYFCSNAENNLIYCHDVNGLMNELKPGVYKPEEWRFFLDASKRSLKGVLLHNTNFYAPIPIAHSVILREAYVNVQKVLEEIQYTTHNWQICGDLKIITMMLGQQSGFTKYPCFLCLWDSRDRVNHYIKKDWPKRDSLVIGAHNVIEEALVDAKKVLLPPLHIKLGLMKQFVRALNQEGNCFQYVQKTFDKLSPAKIKAGVFDGPQIRKLLRDENFLETMNETEKNAWIGFREVVEGFLGNTRAENYREIVANMVKTFKSLECLMSLKLHFLHSHVDYFPENLGAFSEEQGERFHQDIKEMEKRYQGRWDEHMMADYC